MVLGIVLATLVLISCLMIITKKCKNAHFQIWNHKIHKILGFIVLFLGIGHLMITWSLRLQRPAMMYALGFVMVAMVIVLIGSFYFKRKLGKQWIVVHRIAAGMVILCLIGHVYLGINSLQTYKMQVGNLTINNIDLNQVEDGEYIGEENVGYIYCKVRVTVENHALAAVEILEHRTERGKPAEAITETMVAEQRNKVDVVSSATNSSKVIMKAVENALESDKE